MHGKRFFVLLAAALLFGAPTGASATTYNVTDGVVDLAIGCPDLCLFGNTFDLASAGAVGGTIDIGGGTLDLALTATFVNLSEVVGGTEDNGVAEVIFSDLSYSADDLVITPAGGGTFTVSGEATVSGKQQQLDDTATPVNGTNPPADFEANDVIVTGTCSPDGSDYLCGFSFGPLNFNFPVGDPPGIPAFDRYFQHNLDEVAAVPEPGSFVMILTVLGASLLYAGRDRRSC